jgi:threonine/homoserine/homoserine lactone efflux protein
MLQNLLPFILFAFVTSITPGPNNIMILNSALNVGAIRTVPHILGIIVGFGLMLLLIALGGGILFLHVSWLAIVLKYLGSFFMVYIAWKIAIAMPPSADLKKNKRPISFLNAALFQLVNPKAWVMCIGAVSAYHLSSAALVNASMMVVIYELTFICGAIVWVMIGKGLRAVLSRPVLFVWINRVLALLLVASISLEWVI